MQQEEIVRREEIRKQEGHAQEQAALKGAVRILPPSPVTVRKESHSQNTDERGVTTEMHTFSSSTSFSTSMVVGQDGEVMGASREVRHFFRSQIYYGRLCY